MLGLGPPDGERCSAAAVLEFEAQGQQSVRDEQLDEPMVELVRVAAAPRADTAVTSAYDAEAHGDGIYDSASKLRV